MLEDWLWRVHSLGHGSIEEKTLSAMLSTWWTSLAPMSCMLAIQWPSNWAALLELELLRPFEELAWPGTWCAAQHHLENCAGLQVFESEF